MAVRRLADAHEQPESFAFSPDNLEWAKRKIAQYPDGRQASAVIPLLWRAQEQHHGWLPEPAIRLVADMLEMPYIRVFEVATFYTMFQLKPVGTVAHVNVCGTTPCMLRGSEELIKICKSRIAAHAFELSADGRFSWEEVECAGACVNAPMVQIGAETFEDLTPDTFNALLDTLSSGGTPTPGPQSGRRTSEPITGLTSLTTPLETLLEERTVRADAKSDRATEDDPATTKAAGENAGKPDSSGDAEEEAARAEPGKAATNGHPRPPESASDEAKSEAAPATDKSESTSEPATSDAAPAKVEAAPEPAKAEEAPAAPEKVEAASEPAKAEEAPAAPGDAVAVQRADAVGTRPAVLTREGAGEPDSLQQISGIGPVIEKTLNQLGIYKLSQLAAWDQSNKDWVSAYLTFKGRIDRERWVEQAQEILSRGDDA